jgi:hypothetical protein
LELRNQRGTKIEERHNNKNKNKNMLEIAQAQELLVNTFYEKKLKLQGKFLFPTTSYDSKSK